MIDPNEFVDIADHILRTVEATYTEHGVDLPERRYLAVGGQGDTVHDCEQLTVSFEQGYSGIPGNQAQEPVTCASPRTAVFIVEVVRALPLPNTISAAPATTNVPAMYGEVKTGVQVLPTDVQSDIARKQMVDAMLLMDAGLRAGENTIIKGSLADVTAGSPQGGYQAISLVITCAALTAMM